jgi:hypothetical protein
MKEPMVVYCKNHGPCSRDQGNLLQEPCHSIAGTMERCSKNHRALHGTKGPVSELLNHRAMMQGSLLQIVGTTGSVARTMSFVAGIKGTP